MNAAAVGLDGARIGLLTASASRAGGGVFEAVAQHADMIRRIGGEPVVIALRDEYSAADASRFDVAELHHLPVVGPRQIGFAPGLGRCLDNARLDCLHLHGIWMYPSRGAAQWARRTGRPYVISTHGMLSPWIVSRGKLKKALARAGYERASWRMASRLHALTVQEANEIARETGRRDCLVIPNAAPPAESPGDADRPPEFFFVGRIHPKKNLLALVAAWHSRERAVKDAGARLIIAGWGEPDDVGALQAALADVPGAEFIGPCFGEAKAERLRSARFAVLPSLSEGLPMAILEAWAAATPCLMTGECNLPQGFAAGAALDCGHAPHDIAAALDRALSMPAGQWQAMSRAAHGLATGEFSTETISRSWALSYRALLDCPRDIREGQGHHR